MLDPFNSTHGVGSHDMLKSVNALGHFTCFTCYFAFNAFNEAIVVCPNEAISTIIAAIHWKTTELSGKIYSITHNEVWSN